MESKGKKLIKIQYGREENRLVLFSLKLPEVKISPIVVLSAVGISVNLIDCVDSRVGYECTDVNAGLFQLCSSDVFETSLMRSN